MTGLIEHRDVKTNMHWDQSLPREALPDCVTCSKPDLTPSNQEVVFVYSYVQRDQMWVSGMGGAMVMGVRTEAVVAALKHFVETGEVTDPETVMRRIRIVDEEFKRVQNQKLEADSKAANMRAESGDE